MTLWLVRHGQADGADRAGATGGVDGLRVAGGSWLIGHRNPPLSPAGHIQAADAAAAMARIPLAAIHCSDLLRSADTARAIAARQGGAAHEIASHGLVPCADPRLRERAFGAWEGVSSAALQRSDPAALSRLWSDPGFAPPGGESFHALSARALACLGELTAAHPGRPLAVVTHAGVLRTVLADVLGLELAAAMRVEVAWGHAVLLQRFPDGGVRLAGVNLPPPAWGPMWHALEADDFRLTA